MSTYATLQTQVVANLGGRNDADTLSQIMYQMNFVQQILASVHEWDELQKTTTVALVANQYVYTPTELGVNTVEVDRIHSFQLNDGARWLTPMGYVTRNVWNRNHLPDVGVRTGRPSIVNHFGGSYYFSLTPDENYTIKIDYFKKHTKFIADSTVCDFIDKDELIIGLTTGIMWLTKGESQLADHWMKLTTPFIDQLNLDSNRIMGLVTKPRMAKATSIVYNDPFRRR